MIDHKFQVGDKVKASRTWGSVLAGSIGQIKSIDNDDDQIPYLVVTDDGGRGWFKENELELAKFSPEEDLDKTITALSDQISAMEAVLKLLLTMRNLPGDLEAAVGRLNAS